MRKSKNRGADAARRRGSSLSWAAGREAPRGADYQTRPTMARAGWSNLIPGADRFPGYRAFCIDAYSEYMPPPRVGWKPYGPVPVNRQLFSPDDPFGWNVHEFDQAL